MTERITLPKDELEAVARRQCAHLLNLAPGNDSIEALVLLAFTMGAAWALDIDVESALVPTN